MRVDKTPEKMMEKKSGDGGGSGRFKKDKRVYWGGGGRVKHQYEQGTFCLSKVVRVVSQQFQNGFARMVWKSVLQQLKFIGTVQVSPNILG